VSKLGDKIKECKDSDIVMVCHGSLINNKRFICDRDLATFAEFFKKAATEANRDLNVWFTSCFCDKKSVEAELKMEHPKIDVKFCEDKYMYTLVHGTRAKFEFGYLAVQPSVDILNAGGQYTALGEKADELLRVGQAVYDYVATKDTGTTKLSTWIPFDTFFAAASSLAATPKKSLLEEEDMEDVRPSHHPGLHSRRRRRRHHLRRQRRRKPL